MKALFKKIAKIALVVGAFTCLLFGGVFAFGQTSQAKADTSLETEFENNQFEVTSYSGVGFEYVDGASAGLLAGYEGAVLKIDGSSGTAYVNVAFNGIKADRVESIVVKVYSPNYNATDSFRVTATGNGSTIYKEYTANMSAWTEITLTEDVIAQFTQDGYLTAANFGVRARTYQTYYIDSITVNMKADLEGDFTNNGQFALSQYSGLAYEVVNGAVESGLPAGYDGTVLKINGQKYSFVGVDFSAKQIKASDVESIVVRGYSPDYTADDEFRTIDTGLAGYVQYGPGAYDMSTWCDVSLNESSIAQMTDGNGYLSSIYLGLCDKGTVSAYFYIDSITIKMKEVELVYGTPTVPATENAHVGGWGWNHTTDNAAVVKDSNYGYTIITNWTISASTENLAATKNITSLSITLNGETFYDLYQADDGYRLNSQLGYFGFSVPTAALVAGNGYEYPTIEIVNGTPFYDGNYLLETAIIYKDGTWQLKPAEELAETAVFVGPWGNADAYNASDRVLLQYSGDTDWDYTNKGDLASKITYKNSKTSATYTVTESNIAGWKGQKWIVLTGLSGYDTIEIASGGKFGGDIVIPALTLYNVNGRWVTTALQEVTTNFMQIADGWNNKIESSESRNILSYDVKPLGDAADATNLAATLNRTSLMVKYNGKTFCELYANTENANRKQYNISYAHGSRYFYFTIPEADLVDGAIFEVEAGTPFMNNYLGGVKLQFSASANAWIPYVELVYGEPTFEETTNAYVGAWEWNHKTDNAAVVKDSNYGYTIIGNWGIDQNTENLAATPNTTSYSITLNGKSFYELYQQDNGYRLNAQIGYFAFSVPTAALVAGNGYEYPTIEIVNGTPFYDAGYLPETTIIYKDGAWQLKSDEVVDTTNYNPDFVSINSVFNNDANGFLVVQFDTDGWAQGAIPTSYSGITYNGNDISDLVASSGGIKFFQEHSLWFTYSSTAGAKLVAGYNRYSHPTIKIAEGATVVYEEKTYTFHELVLYLVDDKWTTEQPDGWTDQMPTAVSYSDIAWNNVDYGEEGVTDTETLGLSGGALILITYSESLRDNNGTAVNTANLITSDSDVGNKIKINGVALKDVDGAYVCLVSGRVYIYVPTCEVLTIEEGTRFYDYALGEATFYFLGKWSDVPPEYTMVSFDHIEWNNYDYNNYGSIYGQENHAGTPSNGFCGLFAYSGNLGPVNEGGYTTAIDANMATAYLEIGCNLKVNGVAAKDIEGAYISYNAGQEYVYFYIPFSGLAQADVYTLTIEENTKFITAILPATTHYFYDGLFHDNMPVVVTVQYGEITVSNRFSGLQTISSEYLANALSNDAYSVCPLIWTIGGVEYYAGETVEVNTTTTVVIVDAIEFETMRGAAVRISGDGNYGIRFESRIELDSYKALVAKYGESNIKTGTYIAPKALFDVANMSIADYFAQEKGEGAASKYVHISNFDVEKNANGIYNKDSYETDGYIRYFGSLTNLKDSNYYTQFFGVGYITITVNDKTFTVYGLQDVMKTNRTIYDVATMAYSDLDEEYSDTEISVLKQYIDSVAVISYSNGNLFADTEVTGRDYTSAYLVESDGSDYVISSTVSPKAVVVNGVKVTVDIVEQEGMYTFVLTNDYLDEHFGSTLKYGLAEPNHLVWGGGSENGTDALLAGVAQQMGVSSYRIWTNGGMGGVSAGNVVSLGATHKANLKAHVKSLVDVGVNEILFVSCNPIMPYTYESYYVKDSNENYSWISRETLLGGGYTHVYYDTVAVPDPTSEPEAYATWLKVQYDYYVLFAAEVEAWKTEFGWTNNTVQFYFEGLNEPEFQHIIHKKGSYVDGVYTPAYFSTDVLAQVLTDVAYYMTLAVGDCGEVATPALTNITSDSGVDSTTGIYADALLSGMYTKINDNVAPTAIDGIAPVNTNDENDYFTCLNWHPYLHWFKEENSKLYYGEVVTTKTWYGSTKKEAKVNESYADMWVLWNNSMYQIAVNGGDTDSPKVFFSEFGFCDWGNMTGSDNRAILGVNEALAATVFKTLMNKVGELVFVDELTVMAYRLFDIEDLGAGEGNFGFINEQGQLKAIAKEYYLIINGNEDTSDLQAVIDEHFIVN